MTNRAMKDSGVEWIGKIPNNWNVMSSKYLYSIQKGKIPKTVEQKVDEQFVPYVSMEYQRRDIQPKEYAHIDDGVYANKDDIVVLWDGANAGEFFRSKTGIISSTVALLKENSNINKEYLFYGLKAFEENLRALTVGMGIPHVNSELIKNIEMTFPTKTEQQKIAAFLDEKVAHIDNIIEDTKQSIENLKSFKQSLITETVTKGLNPDLKMKDSGIEWIGALPEHWKIIKTKYILGGSGIKIGPFGSALKSNEISSEGPIKVYAQANLIRDDFDYGEKFIDWDKFEQLNMYEIDKGDILISMMGTIGRVSIFPESAQRGIMDSHLTKMNLNHHLVLSEYYKYVFDSSLTTKTQLDIQAKGSIMSGLNSTIIKNIIICLPPILEQKRITEYLDEKVYLLNDLTEGKEKLINELETYKKSLIYEYVTGKKEVV